MRLRTSKPRWSPCVNESDRAAGSARAFTERAPQGRMASRPHRARRSDQKSKLKGEGIVSTTAFVDVSVVPMDAEHIVEHQSVVVRAGRIDSIGPADRVTIPAGALQVDGRDKYLMPGLSDMHVHYDLPECGALFVANGVTTVRNMWGRKIHLDKRLRIAQNQELGPRLYTSGPIIDGEPPASSAMLCASDPALVDGMVLAQNRTGYDFIKIYNSLSTEVYDEIITAGDRHGIPVVGHLPWKVTLKHAISAGQRSIEHMHGFLEALQRSDHATDATDAWSRIRLIDHTDESLLPQLAESIRDSPTWICPTLVTQLKASHRDQPDFLRETPGMDYLHPGLIAAWGHPDPRFAQASPEDFRRLRSAVGLWTRAVCALGDAGADLLVGTDTPNPFVVPGFSVHEELRLFVDSGLSPYSALRAATYNAGRFLGALDLFGTVAVGGFGRSDPVGGEPAG